MTPLERSRELAAIEAALSRGGAVVIEGGAGIGKTSLLNAACEQAASAGHEVLRAKASELESGFPFGVVLQLFERRLAEAPPAEAEDLFAGAAAAARPLVSAQAVVGTSTDMSFAVLHGLYWLAANLAARRPLLLAVDDAHWADEPSLRWLAYLVPRLGGLSLAVVLAVRSAEAELQEAPLAAIYETAAILRPRLLSESASSEVVRQIVGAGATDQLCAAVWHESGGNPFYLREVLRAGGVPAKAHPTGELRRQVARRIRRLDVRALRLGQALAVLGDGCELRHAAAVAGLNVATAAHLAGGLVRLEVLADDTPVRFLHPVLREVLEASLGGDERNAAHRAAAGCLADDGAPPGLVAAHLVRVRPAADPWVVAQLQEASRSALASGAPDIAGDLLRRALSEPPARTERVAVLREAAAAESLAGRAAAGLLEEALALVTDPRQRAEIGLEIAEAHANLYHWPDAAGAYERALVDLGSDESPLALRIESELAVCSLRDARLAARALPVLDRLAGRPLNGVTAEAYAVARAMADHLVRGRPAVEVSGPLLAALERAGPRAENWDLRLPGLVTLLWTEQFAEVEAMLGPMLAEVSRSGTARGLHVTYVTLGLLKLLLGALPEADAAARIALRVLEAAEFTRGLPLVTSILASIATEAGELEEAERLLQHFAAESLPPSLPALRVSTTTAQLRLAQGRPADALHELEHCAAAFGPEVWGGEMHDNGFLHIRSATALALLHLGQRGRAIELAEAEVNDARRFGAPRALGRGLRIAGLARGGEGLAALEESVSVLRSSSALLERAHSLVELGAALRRFGRRNAAREPLAEALDLAARCGARPLGARAREEMKAAGARPRRQWLTGVEALTPAELRVARLAAEGHSNREIAQLLYVTVKTVESHLARAYGKLRISSRAELISGLEPEKIRVSTR